MFIIVVVCVFVCNTVLDLLQARAYTCSFREVEETGS